MVGAVLSLRLHAHANTFLRRDKKDGNAIQFDPLLWPSVACAKIGICVDHDHMFNKIAMYAPHWSLALALATLIGRLDWSASAACINCSLRKSIPFTLHIAPYANMLFLLFASTAIA